MDTTVTDQIDNTLIEGMGYTAFVTVEMPDGHFVEVMSVSPEGGFQGALIARRQGTPTDRVLDAYLNKDDEDYDAPDVKIARIGVHENLLEGVMSDGSSEPKMRDGSAKTLMRTMKSMIRKHLTPEAFDLLRLMPPVGPYQIINNTNMLIMSPNLSLLTQGDQAARVQAIKANFGLLGLMLENEELRDRIDQRLPINRTIQQHYHLGRDQFRSLRKIMKAASTCLSDAEGGRDGQGRHERALLTQTGKLAELARLVRSDQVPSHWEGVARMDNRVRALTGFAKSTGLGPEFTGRALKPVSADQWQDFLPDLNSVNYALKREFSDYLRVTTGVMASSIVMNALLQEKTGLLDGASETASALLSCNDVDEKSLASITALTSLLDRSDIVELRGKLQEEFTGVFASVAGFKELRERCTRWHHINQLLSSAVTSDGVDITWQPLSGDLDLSRCRAVELSSSKMLAEQGVKENHCVGSYVSVILDQPYNGAKAIYSIEDDMGILSTVEVEVSETYDDRGRRSYSARSIQHQGHSNRTPSLKAETAVKDLIEALNAMPQRELVSYIEAIKINPHSIRQKVGKQISTWNGNIYSDQFPKVALSAYQEVMPRRMRGGIPELIDLISPQIQSRIASTVRDALAGEKPKLTERVEPAGDMFTRLSEVVAAQRPRAQSTSWIGIILADLDITDFEVTLSGYGDSGAIDDYDFGRKGETSTNVLASLEDIYLPGTAVSLRTHLDLMIDKDASSEGNWYDNEGGNVWSKYVVENGNLLADTIILTHNEPDEEEDEDDLDDDYENELEDGLQQ